MHLFTHYLAQFYTLNSSFSLQVFTLKVYCSSEWDLIASEEERLIFPDLCHHNCIRTLPVLFIQCQCMENYEKKVQELVCWACVALWAEVANLKWHPAEKQQRALGQNCCALVKSYFLLCTLVIAQERNNFGLWGRTQKVYKYGFLSTAVCGHVDGKENRCCLETSRK